MVNRLPADMVYLEPQRSPCAAQPSSRRPCRSWYARSTRRSRWRSVGPERSPRTFLFRLDPDMIPAAEDAQSSAVSVVDHAGCRSPGSHADASRGDPHSDLAGRRGPSWSLSLLPAVQSSREAARRAQCVNNLKQIALAMHNYHSANNAFPQTRDLDEKGKPLLSWRVAILPYIEQQELYNKFKLDEPWDSPHNKALLKEMPPIYRCPSRTKARAVHDDLPGVRG